MLYCESPCSGHEVRENVGILYLGPEALVRAPLDALIGRIGVVLEGETGYFQFLLIPLLTVQGRRQLRIDSARLYKSIMKGVVVNFWHNYVACHALLYLTRQIGRSFKNPGDEFNGMIL